MASDFQAVCDKCCEKIHIGQIMAGGTPSFAYGPNDKAGHTEAANWIFKHVQHVDVRIERQEVAEKRVSDGYVRGDY